MDQIQTILKNLENDIIEIQSVSVANKDKNAIDSYLGLLSKYYELGSLKVHMDNLASQGSSCGCGCGGS